MKLKRTILLAATLATATTLAMTGCAGGQSSSGAKTYKMTLIPGVSGDPFYITMGCAAKSEAKKLGVNLTIQGPNQFQASLQIPIVNSVAATRPDAILVAPTDSSALYAPLKGATQNGTKVLLVDTTLSNTDIATSAIASNNVAGGEAAFKALAELHPNGGTIAALAVQPGVSTNDLRLQGFKEAAAKDPKFKFAGVQYDNDDTSTATQQTTAMLQKYPNLVGMFASSTYSVDGAAAGLRQAGKNGTVSLVGFDAEPSQLKELRAGTVQALVAQKPADIGKTAVQEALQSLKGKKVTKKVQTGSAIITKDNIDTVGKQYAYESTCS